MSNFIAQNAPLNRPLSGLFIVVVDFFDFVTESLIAMHLNKMSLTVAHANIVIITLQYTGV